ncbi:MAG: hypothetical protein ACXWQQ_11615 [Pseudobdellovibrio sp.]
MREKPLTKNFVRLTVDQCLLLGSIDERLKKMRKDNLLKLSEPGTKISTAVERSETVASNISPYLTSFSKAF